MLHRALRDAVRWDYLARNVAEDAEPPKPGRRPPTVWTPAQLRTFIDHVKDDRLYATYLLLVTTGLRRGAVAGLRRADVDLDQGAVSPSIPRVVVDGKADDGEQKTDSAYRPLVPDTISLTGSSSTPAPQA
ncbi:hypothetical protein CC117_15150 [Parafrankia colletiae]|uniref:Tyr recombinase domain-containing protein n=1 Tax=Parafrankia colletiae TaxID=573497 RepID=A0A1S1QUC5_9ACTN|nr:hypothetical protein [Parafrankia colletiae]MCK9903336.1 hypothetical protein [Frankia sp. Cpl3]OHV38293.1 hypothetical protein CC117_15150 [Parafrankia colletiae]